MVVNLTGCIDQSPSPLVLGISFSSKIVLTYSTNGQSEPRSQPGSGTSLFQCEITVLFLRLVIIQASRPPANERRHACTSQPSNFPRDATATSTTTTSLVSKLRNLCAIPRRVLCKGLFNYNAKHLFFVL